MKLREAAGGDPNLFKAEKYQQKLQNKSTYMVANYFQIRYLKSIE